MVTLEGRKVVVTGGGRGLGLGIVEALVAQEADAWCTARMDASVTTSAHVEHNRVTVWRMTKDCLLHPVEIIPGTWRYPFREIIALARKGVEAATEAAVHREKSAA